MGTAHLTAEELSALVDGELPAQSELRATLHLGECGACSAEYALLLRVDQELQQPVALSCDAALDLLSASLDRQTTDEEDAVAQRHLAECTLCTVRVQEWTQLTTALRALPRLAPSARVDAAIRELVGREQHGAARVRGVAARALVAVTAVIAIVVAGLAAPGRPQTAFVPTPTQLERVLVASMQQAVFNPRNNLLYVLDTPAAAVDARDPASNDLRAHISVGGEPVALALNEAANTILVLDSSQKRVTEIDALSNTVISATQVALDGRPTSISVDPDGTRIIVGAVPSPNAATAAPGTVAVLNSATKQLETVRDVSVAPRLLVPDPQRPRTAIVSSDAVTIVDGTYSVLEVLPGGVSAAFSRRRDTIAILSARGTGSRVTFTGAESIEPVQLQGSPRALIALPDGGYLVLTEREGRGRVSKIARDGAVVGTVEVASAVGDLVYDDATNRFAIATSGRLDVGEIPGEVAFVTRSPEQNAPPIVATSPTPAASSSAAPSASPTATPGTTSAAPVVATTPAPNVLESAVLIDSGLYRLALPAGVRPQRAVAAGQRVWFVDQANTLRSFDMNTGDLYVIGSLRPDARIDYLVAGSTYIYGVDASNGEIHLVNYLKERIEGAFATNVLSPVAAVAVGRDDRLWIGLRNASYLFAWDPRTHLMNGYDLGTTRVSALAVDPQGRIFYADDLGGTVGTFDPRSSRLEEVGFAKTGVTTALLVDSNSTLWLGTSAGEVFSVRGRMPRLTVSLQRPVTALTLDQRGRAWYVAPLPGGLAGFTYAPADGTRAPRTVPGPVASLAFSALGRGILADPRGGFYIGIEGGR